MELSLSTVTELYTKYKDNPVALKKLDSQINEYIPSMIETYVKKATVRKEKELQVQKDAEVYASQFVEENGLCFNSHLDVFWKYDGTSFRAHREDDILAQIFKEATDMHCFRGALSKVRGAVLKKLRATTLFDVKASGETVGSTIKFFMSYFHAEESVVTHFLCAIGDAVRGQSDFVYIVPALLKHAVHEMDGLYYSLFGVHSLLSSFKHRHHHHEFSKTRFFGFPVSSSPNPPPPFLRANSLSVIATAYTLSSRFGCADGYVSQCANERLCSNVFFTRSLTQSSFVSEFIKEALVYEQGNITKKQLQFILRCHLRSHNLPNIIFFDPFITELSAQLKQPILEAELSSPYLKTLEQFDQFWATCMVESEQPMRYSQREFEAFFKEHCPDLDLYAGQTIDLIRYSRPEALMSSDHCLLGYKHVDCDKEAQISALRQIHFGAPCYQDYILFANEEKKRVMSVNSFNELMRAETDS